MRQTGRIIILITEANRESKAFFENELKFKEAPIPISARGNVN